MSSVLQPRAHRFSDLLQLLWHPMNGFILLRDTFLVKYVIEQKCKLQYFYMSLMGLTASPFIKLHYDTIFWAEWLS